MMVEESLKEFLFGGKHDSAMDASAQMQELEAEKKQGREKKRRLRLFYLPPGP